MQICVNIWQKIIINALWADKTKFSSKASEICYSINQSQQLSSHS